MTPEELEAYIRHREKTAASEERERCAKIVESYIGITHTPQDIVEEIRGGS